MEKKKRFMLLSMGLAVLTFCMLETVFGAVSRTAKGYPYKPLLGFIKYPEILIKMVKPFMVRSGLNGGYDLITLYAITYVVLAAALLIAFRLIYKKPIGFRLKGLIKGIFVFGLPILGLAVFWVVSAYRAIGDFKVFSTMLKNYAQDIKTLSYVVLQEFSAAIFFAALAIVVFTAIKEYGGNNRKSIYIALFLAALICSLPMLMRIPDYTVKRLAVGIICLFLYYAMFIAVYANSKNIFACIIVYGIEKFSNAVFGSFGPTKIVYGTDVYTKADYDTGTIVTLLLVYGIAFAVSMILLKKGLDKQEEEAELVEHVEHAEPAGSVNTEEPEKSGTEEVEE